MNNSELSGIMWIVAGIFMFLLGVYSLIKGDIEAALAPFSIGGVILLFQFFIYKRTGSVRGIF